jgi:hypothetical protein
MANLSHRNFDSDGYLQMNQVIIIDFMHKVQIFTATIIKVPNDYEIESYYMILQTSISLYIFI